jgi:hypothetical protein
MHYLIVDGCTKDEPYVDTCPVSCIHPTKDGSDFATVRNST